LPKGWPNSNFSPTRGVTTCTPAALAAAPCRWASFRSAPTALLKDNSRDNILVVVGALHLVGNDGVVRMLAKRGYRVERVK